MNVGGIPAAGERKPDPDDPWRYVCPDCACQVHGRPNKLHYECTSCNRVWDADELFDKKTGRIAGAEPNDDTVPK